MQVQIRQIISCTHTHSEKEMDYSFCNDPTVEGVFLDFKGRRAGLITALTTDLEEFYQQCEPEKDNLCLYGLPCGKWEVNLPLEDLPTDLPEPAVGINYVRDGMQEKNWLSHIAIHSDAWLLAVSFSFGAQFEFDRADRKRLFNMINDLPTVLEVVSDAAKKEKSSVSNLSSNKSKSNSKSTANRNSEDEHEETVCGACGEKYALGFDEFWIWCYICESWFHGQCVKITTEHIEQYKCPECSNKRV